MRSYDDLRQADQKINIVKLKPTNMKKLSLIILLLAAITACQPSKEKGNTESEMDGTVTEKDSARVAYTCPMHPEVSSDAPGKCPKCGMELVKKSAADHMHTDSTKHD